MPTSIHAQQHTLFTGPSFELKSAPYFTMFYVIFPKLLPSGGCSLNNED